MRPYDPSDWYWKIGGNATRFWSSAACAYVTELPDGWHATAEDAIATGIPRDEAQLPATALDEADLSARLRRYGLQGPIADIADVKAEAQRRIIALTGTATLLDCIIKQSNANMRANELNDKRIDGAQLTPSEAAEADALRGLATAIKAIRAKSNEIEVMTPIPADFTSDAYWS